MFSHLHHATSAALAPEANIITESTPSSVDHFVQSTPPQIFSSIIPETTLSIGSSGGGGSGFSFGNIENYASGPQCQHCGKIYSNASNLRQHVRNVHVLVDKSLWHACNICNKKLKTKHYLINHQLQAHGVHQRNTDNGQSSSPAILNELSILNDDNNDQYD